MFASRRQSIFLVVIMAVLILPLCFSSHAQAKMGLAFIVEANSLLNNAEEDHTRSSYRETSEIKLLFIGVIRLYQLFISSQDMPVCVFTPSCSQFGIEAIQKCGFLPGILLTSDRLQRCNNMSNARYQMDYGSGRFEADALSAEH